MEYKDYWDKVTEDTTIDWLRRRNLLSVRASNILTRGAIYMGGGKTNFCPIKTVKGLLEIDEYDLRLYRNMGGKSLAEIEVFKEKFLEKVKKGNVPKTIKQWCEEVHENAKAHGWWENPPKAGELLMLVTSEVAEAFEEVRKGKGMTETYYREDGKMEGIPSELADVVIRVMDMCEHYGIDLEKTIAEKHAFNKTRPYKHGGKVL